MTAKRTTPRQSKTPQQRAQEALDVEERRVKRLRDQWQKAHDDAERLAAELDVAEKRRDYLKQHPDLQQNPTTTTGAPTA